MIEPEVEPQALAGFPSRKLDWDQYEKLIEASPDAVGADAVPWEVARQEDRVADEVARVELAAAPWWLWWNVLSLDAPMVAVAWALVFAKCAGVQLPGAEVAALGLVVWLIYTVDRLLDGRWASRDDGGAFGSPLRQRHFFHRIYARRIARVAAGVAAFTAVLVSARIGEEVLKLAVPVALTLVLYMAWVHLGRRKILSRLPKEVAVGAIFAAGVALPAWSRLGARRWEFFLLAVLFAGICTLNCAAIEEWELARARDRASGTTSSQNAETDFGSGRFAVGLAVCAALMTPVVRLRGEFSAIGAAIALSALLILLLDLVRERISADGLRVLVDVALLAPALVVLAIR